jgi:hypothetical protein
MKINNKLVSFFAVSSWRISLLLLVLSAVLAGSAHAQTVLGQEGEWQVRLERGTTAMTGELCVISTVSEIEGGRRERPQIRIIPATRQIVIDPDNYLSRVITGIAMLENRSDRRQPNRVLEHRVRIDDGEIVTASEKDPRFGAVEATKDAADFERVMQKMSSARLLRYEWQLDRGSRSYEYSLNGFAEMHRLTQEHQACRLQSP